MSIEAIRASALEQISGLRHAAHLDDQDVARWVDVMALREPARIGWHIRRNDGVSSSSLYTYIAQMRGEYTPFQTARELDLLRMFKMTPSAPTADTQRGSLLESLPRQLFHRRYRVSTREDLLESMSRQLGHPRAPALRGNADDLVSSHSFEGLLLPDYKIPRKEPEEEAALRPAYVTQLHAYTLLGLAAGIKVRQMALVNLTLAPELAEDLTGRAAELHGVIDRALLSDDMEGLAVAEANYHAFMTRVADFLYDFMLRDGKSVALVVQHVPWDKTLASELIMAVNEADRRALNGEILPYPKRELMELPEDRRAALQVVGRDFLRLQKLGELVEQLTGETKAEIKRLLEGVETKGKTSPIPGVSAIKASFLNADKAIEYLARLGVDTSAVTDTRYDFPKMVAALKQAGHDPRDFISSTPAKKGATEAIRGLLSRHQVPAEIFTGEQLRIGVSQAKGDLNEEAISGASRFAFASVQPLLDRAETPRAHTTYLEHFPDGEGGEAREGRTHLDAGPTLG